MERNVYVADRDILRSNAKITLAVFIWLEPNALLLPWQRV